MNAPGPSAVPSLPLPGTAQSGWMRRNWPWFVLAVATVVSVFAASLFFLITHFLKSSDAYTHAMQMVRADSRVTAALGTPLEDGAFVTGKYKYNDRWGWARLYTTLSGPKGRAQLEIHADRSGTSWVYTRLMLTLDGTSEQIDVLRPPAPP